MRTAKKPFSVQQQSSILSLCRLLTLAISLPGYDSPLLLGSSPRHQLTKLALPPGYTLCTGLAHTKGGGRPEAPKRSRSSLPDSSMAISDSHSKKKQKNRLLPGASSPRRRSSKSERSPEPRPTPVSRSTKRCLSQDETSSVSSFTLTPSQTPGPVRPLEEIRPDPRIQHHGPDIGIAPTLLPFSGEGLFSRTDLFFPMYDGHGKKKKWNPMDLVICEYRGVKVKHSQAILPSYHSAYLCELDGEWDIDAQEYTSCYDRFANDNFQDKTINCRLFTYTFPGTQERKLLLLALPGVRIVPGEELYASYGGDYWLDHLPCLLYTSPSPRD